MSTKPIADVQTKLEMRNALNYFLTYFQSYKGSHSEWEKLINDVLTSDYSPEDETYLMFRTICDLRNYFTYARKNAEMVIVIAKIEESHGWKQILFDYCKMTNYLEYQKQFENKFNFDWKFNQQSWCVIS